MKQGMILVTIWLAAIHLLAAATLPAPAGSTNRVAARAVAMPEPPATAQSVLDGCNEFAWRLQRTLAADKPHENVFVSPLSIAVAISMAWNGARGKTAQEMAAALGFRNAQRSLVNQVMSNVVRVLRHPGAGTQLAIANALWLRAGLQFKPDFVARVRATYAAELATVNFTAPASLDLINGWVSTATQKKISGIVQYGDFNQETLAVLVNAVVFKGAWLKPFSKWRTWPRRFTNSAGKKHLCWMMQQTEYFLYAAHPDGQTIRLPYQDEQLAMYVMLPATNSSLANLMAHASMPQWCAWQMGMREEECTIALPRLQVDCNTMLNEPLLQLGMTGAFAKASTDLDDMAIGDGHPTNVFLAKLHHKAIVKIDEAGTEAAAATSVEEELDGSPPPLMIVNRPFLFAICHEQSGMVLFMGTIMHVP
jgi:serpin B